MIKGLCGNPAFVCVFDSLNGFGIIWTASSLRLQVLNMSSTSLVYDCMLTLAEDAAHTYSMNYFSESSRLILTKGKTVCRVWDLNFVTHHVKHVF